MNKTLVEINSNNYASTGDIMNGVANEARKNGYAVYTCCKKSRASKRFHYDNQIYIGTWIDRVISERLGYITGLKNYFNVINTAIFINRLKKIKPDIIHLHSLTDTFVNLRMLFNYISKNNIPVVWTFHDIFTMTGQCFFSDYVNCDKWKYGCGNCPQLHREPASLIFDNTKLLWKKKKQWFTSVSNMTVVTPSAWLAGLVKESFFNKYPVKVINNGINLNIFKPTESNFRKEHNLENKYLVLGIAYKWEDLRKGADVFNRLANDLDDKYQIIMVGTNDNVDKTLNSKIISIHKTYNKEELIKIYSTCDVFAMPTREDNFPTVNMEAIACGLPVLTYRTGGSPEAINETCGSVVEKDDYDNFLKEIKRICETKPYSKEACLKRSKQFAVENKYKEYIQLFNEILS